MPAQAMHLRKPRRSIPSWSWLCVMISDIIQLLRFFLWLRRRLAPLPNQTGRGLEIFPKTKIFFRCLIPGARAVPGSQRVEIIRISNLCSALNESFWQIVTGRMHPHWDKPSSSIDVLRHLRFTSARVQDASGSAERAEPTCKLSVSLKTLMLPASGLQAKAERFYV